MGCPFLSQGAPGGGGAGESMTEAEPEALLTISAPCSPSSGFPDGQQQGPVDGSGHFGREPQSHGGGVP